jgi:hypothetical protein
MSLPCQSIRQFRLRPMKSEMNRCVSLLRTPLREGIACIKSLKLRCKLSTVQEFKPEANICTIGSGFERYALDLCRSSTFSDHAHDTCFDFDRYLLYQKVGYDEMICLEPQVDRKVVNYERNRTISPATRKILYLYANLQESSQKGPLSNSNRTWLMYRDRAKI